MTDFYNGGMHGERFGDKAFISEQVDLLPISMQKKVMDGYSKMYRTLIATDPINARYRCNRRLRITVEKHKAQGDGGLF